MDSEIGYVFSNYLDAICYLFLAILYPFLTFVYEIGKVDISDFGSMMNFMLCATFFILSFFHDFYNRYKDCNEQTASVVNLLFWGRNIFAIVLLIMAFIILLTSVFFDHLKVLHIAFVLVCLFATLSVYPLVVALRDIVKRIKSDIVKKRAKISR